MFIFIFCMIGVAAGMTTSLIQHLQGLNIIADHLLYYQMIITLPLCGIYGFSGHTFKSDYVANFIGWRRGNPFQKEVAYANLAYGIAALGAIFMSREYWLGVIICFSIFYMGAALIHIKETIRANNLNAGNALMILPDIIMPIFLIVLYVLGTS